MYQLITLPNGARLLTQEVPGARSAALGFFVGVGTRHERPEENGAAHFIEHMLFKGTECRTAAQLARDTDAIGGQHNAYTTKEYTCYYIRTLDHHLDRGLDILSDMLFHSKFDTRDAEVERNVILKEIGMYEDAPDDLVSKRLSAAIFKGTPLAQPILGKESTLAQMDGDWLRAWHKEHYHAGVLVVSLAGSFTQAQVDRLTQLLASLPSGPAPTTKPSAYKSAITVRQKDTEQNHLILAFPSTSYLDPRRSQTVLFNALLGGGCSSRLFQELREKQGLCYAVYSYTIDYADTGFLGIYAAVSPNQERPALEAARQTVLELAEHGPTQEELDRVREQTKANLLMGMESVKSRMSHMGASTILYGRVREIQERIDQYDAVTREQLRDLAGEMFRMENASLSAVGRVGTEQDYAAWMGR